MELNDIINLSLSGFVTWNPSLVWYAESSIF